MKTYFSGLFLMPRRRASYGACLLAITSLVFAWPNQAQAQAANLGDIMCNAFINLAPYGNVINAVAWVFGSVLVGMGLMSLKEYHDSPHNHPIHRGVLKIGAGAAMLTMPFFTSAIINSIFLTPGPAGNWACVAGPTAAVVAPDLVTMLQNFIGNIEAPIIQLTSVTAFTMGVLFIATGLIKAARYGTDPKGASVTHIVTYLIIGAILICASEGTTVIMTSLFGVGGYSMDYVNNANNVVLNWNAVQALGGNARFAMAISTGLTFVQIVGMLSFVRGIYIVKNAIEGSGQSTMAQGLTHIIGGVIALNIFTFLESMDNTFGTNLLL